MSVYFVLKISLPLFMYDQNLPFLCVFRSVCQPLARLPEDRDHDVCHGQVSTVCRRGDRVGCDTDKILFLYLMCDYRPVL